MTYDHNGDSDGFPKAVMNEGSDIYDGSAWHCDAGSVGAMSSMHDAYPNKNIYLTECSGTFNAGDFGDNMKWNMQNMTAASSALRSRTPMAARPWWC